MTRDAILRQNDPVETLTAFVISEIGRTADERLDSTYPLCLYFPDENKRKEFVDAVLAAKPGMISKHWP